MVKRGELRHDVAVYRAAQKEQRRLAEQGLVVERILIDAEIKRELAQAQKHPHPSMERRRIAGELELPVGDKGRVHIPDAQLQYRDIEGRGGRVSIEVVSEHYSAESIAAKAAAGFSLHSAGGGAKANGRVLAKIAAALGSASGSGSRSGGGGGRGRASGSIDL